MVKEGRRTVQCLRRWETKYFVCCKIVQSHTIDFFVLHNLPQKSHTISTFFPHPVRSPVCCTVWMQIVINKYLWNKISHLQWRVNHSDVFHCFLCIAFGQVIVYPTAKNRKTRPPLHYTMHNYCANQFHDTRGYGVTVVHWAAVFVSLKKCLGYSR